MNKDQQLRLECLRIAGGVKEIADDYISYMTGTRSRRPAVPQLRTAKPAALKKATAATGRGKAKKTPAAQAA